MKIEPIIYETTRGIYSVEDKLSIATLILFSWRLGSETFCKLLYTKDYNKFISDLSHEYKSFDIKLDISLDNKQIKNALIKTVEKVREKEDKDGYLKALYEGDEFAVMINNMINKDLPNIELKLKDIQTELDEINSLLGL
jgi:hypothetical protein